MVFSNLFFIFAFIPLFALLYLLSGAIDRRRKAQARKRGKELRRPMLLRNIVLTIFSLLFYAWGEPIYVFLMLAVVLVNFLCALQISKGVGTRYIASPASDSLNAPNAPKGLKGFIPQSPSSEDSRLKTADSADAALSSPSLRRGLGGGRWRLGGGLWLFLGLAANLAALASFKYLGFFSGIARAAGLNIPDPQIALPIGISFYIFQSISYLVDVYRRESAPQRNYFDLLLYISMFPQLIAGPIVRYGTVAKEITNRHASVSDVSAGVYRFIIGLGKKVVIANIMGEIAGSLLDGDLTNLSAAAAWVGIIAFSIQIYFDFSGYSDMAIGIGRCVGFHFPENFNHPYISTSMTDFWRRWHMSLGSFFRDYVYIPMGGNRRHQALNILTVWFLTGMWHGASWNFIIWGLYFGLIIMIEKYTLLRWNVPRLGLYVYSLFLIIVGWGIFYFDDFGRMSQFFTAFFGGNEPQGFPMQVETLIFDNLWLWVAAIILCLPVRAIVERWADTRLSARSAAAAYAVEITRALISICILVCCVALLVGATNNAFIYTRF